MAKAAFRSKAVVLLLLTFVYCYSHCWSLYFFLCFVERYFMSILVLQSRESWLLCLVCLPGVSCWLCGCAMG